MCPDGPMSAVICPSGSFCPENSQVAIPCPEGFTSPLGSSDDSFCVDEAVYGEELSLSQLNLEYLPEDEEVIQEYGNSGDVE